MYISIIGHALSGKTTLFQALSGAQCEAGFSDKTAVTAIDVADERLDMLSTVFKPKKTVYARVEVTDSVAISQGDAPDKAINPKTLQQMRSSDAFILTVGCFDEKTPEQAAADVHAMKGEFILSDMAQIETRLERMRKQGKKGDTGQAQEESLLARCLTHLNEEMPLFSLALNPQELRTLRGYQFLSLKPLMIFVNASEHAVDQAKKIAEHLALRFPESPVIWASAKLESELAAMDNAERTVFMEEYAIAESIRGRIIRLAYETLGLISFLTVGEDECRAWPVRQGSNAQDAAGAIHGDLAAKFIRAETMSYDDFIRHGSMAECKKAGVWRLEGKTYVVKDGDILTIRAGT
ncbi:MAG TPA: DUF933 domain-containing protein [Syntrophorhabdaceae bacterium]|nr:DUF933 domain-containing protein [Syntrophorhabdaceae bacterium]